MNEATDEKLIKKSLKGSSVVELEAQIRDFMVEQTLVKQKQDIKRKDKSSDLIDMAKAEVEQAIHEMFEQAVDSLDIFRAYMITVFYYSHKITSQSLFDKAVHQCQIGIFYLKEFFQTPTKDILDVLLDPQYCGNLVTRQIIARSLLAFNFKPVQIIEAMRFRGMNVGAEVFRKLISTPVKKAKETIKAQKELKEKGVLHLSTLEADISETMTFMIDCIKKRLSFEWLKGLPINLAGTMVHSTSWADFEFKLEDYCMKLNYSVELLLKEYMEQHVSVSCREIRSTENFAQTVHYFKMGIELYQRFTYRPTQADVAEKLLEHCAGHAVMRQVAAQALLQSGVPKEVIVNEMSRKKMSVTGVFEEYVVHSGTSSSSSSSSSTSSSFGFFQAFSVEPVVAEEKAKSLPRSTSFSGFVVKSDVDERVSGSGIRPRSSSFS